MSDAEIRDAQRRAASGILQDEVRALSWRIRAAQLSMDKVELAAFCGSRAALAIVGDKHLSLWVPMPFESWVRVLLSKWGDSGPVPGWVSVMASISAARVALPEWEKGELTCRCGSRARDHERAGHEFSHMCDGDTPSTCECVGYRNPARVIYLADMWLSEHPIHRESAIEAWRQAWFEREWSDARWLPWVWSENGEPGGPPVVGDQTRNIVAAARIAGDEPVRKAICEKLISWALGYPSAQW